MPEPHEQYDADHENYEDNYGFVSWKDKIVLDIGADWGSTPYFFLQQGAQYIIAVEPDNRRFSFLEKYAQGEKRVVAVKKRIEVWRDLELLIQTYQPDIVKMDCEGCEVNLLSVDVTKVKEWMIEIHTQQLLNRLMYKFLSNGFVVARAWKWGDTECCYMVHFVSSELFHSWGFKQS